MNYNPETKKYIYEIKEAIKQIETVYNITDSYTIELNIMQQYKEFYDNYPFLVKKLCKRENLEFLDVIMDNLDSVHAKEKNFDIVEKELAKRLAEQYNIPNVNTNNE